MSDDGHSTRWRDIVLASNEGLAVFDGSGRYALVNAQFAALTGHDPDDLVGKLGLEVHADIEMPRELDHAIRTRQPLRFEDVATGDDGTRSWTRITLVPLERGDDEPWLAVLALDITDLRATEAKRREAQQQLASVEEEQRRQACQQIHDGPVQLLAALALRLAATEATDEDESAAVGELEQLVRVAADELRMLITELEPIDAHVRAGSQLEQRIAPILQNSQVRVELIDATSSPVSPTTREAMVVVLHEMIDIGREEGVPKVLRCSLSEEDDERIRLELVDSEPLEHPSEDIRDPHRRTAGRYVEELGGSFRVLRTDSEYRVVVSLPRRKHDQSDGGVSWFSATSRTSSPPVDVSSSLIGDRASLTEQDWKAIVTAAHEGLFEIDADLRITYLNDQQAATMQRALDEVLGRELRELLHPGDYARLEPHIRQLTAGEPVRFEWQRQNLSGETRWVQVSGFPRMNPDGSFANALVVSLDTTALHESTELLDAVLVDLQEASAAARATVLRRVHEGPLRRLVALNERLEGLQWIDGSESMTVIRRELDRSMAEFEVAGHRPLVGDLSEGNRGAALRHSLRAVLSASDVELEFRDEAAQTPPDDQAYALFRIAREAVANAVTHGNAKTVILTLQDAAGGYQLEIRDDGAGISETDLAPSTGHMGMRTMHAIAAEQGGWCSVGAAPEGGTVVRAWIPRGPVHLLGAAQR